MNVKKQHKLTSAQRTVLQRVLACSKPEPGTNPGNVYWYRERYLLDKLLEMGLVIKRRIPGSSASGRGRKQPKYMAVITPNGIEHTK